MGGEVEKWGSLSECEYAYVCVCVSVLHLADLLYIFFLLPSPLTLSNWIHFALVFV